METAAELVPRAVMILLGLAVALYLIPALKQSRAWTAAKTAVRAAEKLARTGKLEKSEKKEWAERMLGALGLPRGPYTDMLIEAAVELLDESVPKEEDK